MAEINPALINSFLPDNDDEDLLGGAAAKKERDIIESNRVKLANYIHDVTTLFPLLRQEGIFTRDDVEIIEAPVTTTAKVDKCLDVLLRKGPRAIGVFHEALSYHYRHLFNYLAQLFTQAGLELPPSRQMKDDEVELKEADPLDIRRSRSYSTYRNGSRSVTIRKRLEVMSRQCEMMEKEKDGLQRALGDREREISSLLSTKTHVQTSLNNVQSKYLELLSQLSDWRALLESDTAAKQWTAERESIQQEYDQMEQEYNLQCSELNAARERISLLLQQLERSEKIVSIIKENCQKEKDNLKHKLAVQDGEIQRLLSKLDYVITTPTRDETSGSSESPGVRCEKLQCDLERANDQISTLNSRVEALQRERMQAYDEREDSVSKLYFENMKRKSIEKENKKLKVQLDSVSNCSDPLNSPQTPQKVYGPTGPSWMPSQTLPMRITSFPGEESLIRNGGVKLETVEVFMPAPRVDAELGMKLELGIVVKELKDGSLPHKHGVRIGDEICQVNRFSLYGERPLEFFNRLLYSATQPVTLLLRRQVPAPEQSRQCTTLPPLATSSSLTNRPISPCLPSPLPFPSNSSTIFPMNPQLGAATLSRKSPAFQEPTTPNMAGSPVNVTVLDTTLDGKALPRPIGRVSTDGTSNSTHSTNKEFFSSSSSDEDVMDRPGNKKGPRTPLIIQQQKYHQSRMSTESSEIGIVGSPTDKTAASVWKDKRLTRISTIDSGFEFPFNDQEDYHDVNVGILESEDWEVVGRDSVNGMEEIPGDGDAEGDGKGEEKVPLRRRVRAVRSNSGGPRRQNGVYKKAHVSRSLDDLNETHNKPAPVRRQSRNGERTVSVTKEEFSNEMKLIGGRGYGIFIETDSRKHTVETGDRLLEVGDRCVQGLMRAEVVELLDTVFSGKDGAARLTVLYDAKALSQLPPDAKDDFYVRCTRSFRPTQSFLSKNNNELAFEKGDVLHITNTLPQGHTGFWQAQKVGSKGETLAVGLVPITVCPEMADEGSLYRPQIFRGPKSPKCYKTVSIEDHKSLLSRALHIYRPVRRVSEVQDPRPVVLLGVLQKDFRKHLVDHCHTGTPDNVKFCFPTSEELEKYAEDEIVEKLQVDGKTMLTTTSHIKELAREGYHCVLSCDADGLHLPGLQNLLPIVLMLHATAVRVVNKIRQRLPQDGEFNAQEEIDCVDSLKRYRQYFTGQIDLQGTMSDVAKEIKTTVVRQQKSVIWENDS